MANNKNKARPVQDSYQPIIAGDSYRPVPETEEQIKSFVPPAGGTGARTIQIKTLSPVTPTPKK